MHHHKTKRNPIVSYLRVSLIRLTPSNDILRTLIIHLSVSLDFFLDMIPTRTDVNLHPRVDETPGRRVTPQTCLHEEEPD